MINHHGMVKEIRIGESATKHPERMKAQRLSLGRAFNRQQEYGLSARGG